MKVRLFGRLRDALDRDEFDVDVPHEIADSAALRSWLGSAHPALLDPSVRMALDDCLVIEPVPIGSARDVSFLPTVSGG